MKRIINRGALDYMELGRWDFSQRVGFISLMRKKGWGLAVGGASIRYRRRIPLLKKFTHYFNKSYATMVDGFISYRKLTVIIRSVRLH